MTKKKTIYSITTIFTAAFLIRCAVYVIMGRLAHPKFWEYHDIAENFLLGKGLMFPFLDIPNYAYAEPFYPLLSAVVYFVTQHNYVIFGIVNMLASSAVAIAVYYLGKELFDERVGLLAALLTAFHPGLVYFATQFHPLTFNALFAVLIILTLTRLYRTPKVKNAVITGIVMGLAFLDRSSCLIFIPIAAGLIVFSSTSARLKLKLCAIVILITLIPVAAWSMRNYAVLHKFVITRSSTGYLFWIGNNPNSKSSATYDQNTAAIETLGKDTLDKFKAMNELEINTYLMDDAVSYVKSHPWIFLSRWAKRFYYFWWFSPSAGMFYPPQWFVLYRAFYIFMLVTAMYALISIIAGRKKMKNTYLPGVYLMAVFVLLISATQTLFYIEGRHRWVIEPMLMIFSSWTIIRIIGFKERGRFTI